ncbi:MAG: PEP-CTERM system histidine kinase PrsK [bacterium]|nr:PEP-CTERM system histidine kinase PrsK [bacterium]
MFTIYDLAEIGACFAAFFSMLFVLVRKPGHLSGHFFVAAALTTGLMWAFFIGIIPRFDILSHLQHGLLTGMLSSATGFWLLFLLVFAREPAANLFRRRSLTVYAILTLLILAAIGAFFSNYFTIVNDDVDGRYIEITVVGRYYLTLLIVANAFGLLQLESTYRASHGRLRRSLVLPILTTALLLAVNIVSGMMGLLIARVEFMSIQISALLMMGSFVLLARFVVYEERQGQGVVVSREAVYSSVALVLIGGYFIVIGAAVKLLVSLGGSPQIFLSVLAAFVVILFFVALIMSGSIRNRWRSIVDRSIYSGKVELLTEITAFAEDVTAATDRQEMFAAIEHVLQHRCSMNNTVIYLRGDKLGEFVKRYPETVLGAESAAELEQYLFRIGRMSNASQFLALGLSLKNDERAFVESYSSCELIPLVARKEFVGFIACQSDKPIPDDVRFLIDSISHQLALSLLSVKQSEKLLETRELASFTKVSSFVIHDVKNLISMLSMIMQNAERKFDDPRFQQMTTETLRGAQERMKRLINRLSSPSDHLDFVLTNCDLHQTLLSLIEEMKLSAQNKITVVTEIENLPMVRGNEEKLRSVLSNLIINAIEAMPNGGELRFLATQDDNTASLTVQDTGSGMTAEFMRDRLFRPFQTSKPSGLGIGLFQSRELVEQMGGQLTVTSVVGQGSSFKLKLKKA